MGTPARIVLLVGLALVLGLVVGGRHDTRVAGRADDRSVLDDGVLEGRVTLADGLVALRRRADTPALLACVQLPLGVVSAEVEDNGRFCLSGLPRCAVDVELRLGGEVLAKVAQVTPRALESLGDLVAPEDPRLQGVALAGPLRRIELGVVGLDGAGLDHGWLAWRASGEAEYERVVPVLAGSASIVTSAEVVDVLALIVGCEAGELVCAVGGERLVVAPVAPIVAFAPEVPAGIALRLELVGAAPLPGLVGEAHLRSCEVRGGWSAADGRAELQVVGARSLTVQWGSYQRHLDRLTRARGLRAVPVEVSVAAPGGGFGERVIVAPLEIEGRAQRRERGWSR